MAIFFYLIQIVLDIYLSRERSYASTCHRLEIQFFSVQKMDTRSSKKHLNSLQRGRHFNKLLRRERLGTFDGQSKSTKNILEAVSKGCVGGKGTDPR